METELLKNRAWIEVNLHNLEHNINEIKKIIPSKTEIMAVVKANAYGLGIIEISRKLENIGISCFAVATLEEALLLRENKITGNILILGFTGFCNLHYVVDNDLIQTVVDEDYAKKLLELKFDKKIKVHIKVNTGMNRIGINHENISIIKKLYFSKNIDVLGVFSHLCVADSNSKENILFTENQIFKFKSLIESLKSAGINNLKYHLQSSYGIINYNELEFDYVRPGIIMYGVDSSEEAYSKIKLDLKPVLSVKARITSVKEIDKNDSVSYGRTYISSKKEKIATVSIGYADGYPRNLSNCGVRVLVNGTYHEIIGRICMDQLIIKVNNDSVKIGDIVTLIGKEQEISCVRISKCSNTISNELLSRLGTRLNRVIV